MTPPHERAWTWLTTTAGRFVFGVTNLRGWALERIGVRSPSRVALMGWIAAYVDPRIAAITPDYEPRRPRWYAGAWPLPCSRPGCGLTTCRHERPAHADRLERKRARRVSR